jgi:hypothetical protein
VLVEAVARVVVDRGVRPVDRDLGEVRTTEPGELGVEVGEVPAGEQRVVGRLDPRHEVPGVEGDLLVSAKKVVGLPLSTSVPMTCTGASSSGTILVGSSRSMPSNVSSGVSGKTCKPNSHSGKAPFSMAS